VGLFGTVPFRLRIGLGWASWWVWRVSFGLGELDCGDVVGLGLGEVEGR
jgi:hypothetical protein